jgi:hypothetical protein
MRREIASMFRVEILDSPCSSLGCRDWKYAPMDAVVSTPEGAVDSRVGVPYGGLFRVGAVALLLE